MVKSKKKVEIKTLTVSQMKSQFERLVSTFPWTSEQLTEQERNSILRVRVENIMEKLQQNRYY